MNWTRHRCQVAPLSTVAIACFWALMRLCGRFAPADALLEHAAEDMFAHRHLPLAAQHESAGAVEQRDQATLERGRHFPDTAIGHPARRRHSRARRRGGRGRASLLQCGIDEAIHGADAPSDGTGDLRGDCVTEGIGWALVEKPALSVHGRAAVAATPWLNSGKARASYTP